MLLFDTISPNQSPSPMIQPSPSYHHFVHLDTTKESDLLRFCLSDTVTRSVECVVDDKTTPVDYAQYIVKHHGNLVDKRFFVDDYPKDRYPVAWRSSFVFDQLVTVASLYRAIMVRPSHENHVIDVLRSAQIHLLLLQYPNIPASHYSGLGNFGIAADCFIQENKSNFIDQDIDRLQKLVSLVSYMGHDDWLFHNKAWQKVLAKKPSALVYFRMFLHSALVSRSMTDEQLSNVFLFSSQDIAQISEAFIALCEIDPVSETNIVEFLDLLPMYFGQSGAKHYYGLLMEVPFEMFNQIDQQVFAHLRS